MLLFDSIHDSFDRQTSSHACFLSRGVNLYVFNSAVLFESITLQCSFASNLITIAVVLVSKIEITPELSLTISVGFYVLFVPNIIPCCFRV